MDAILHPKVFYIKTYNRRVQEEPKVLYLLTERSLSIFVAFKES